MANDNHIDQLFKQKLAGRKAAGYSASAWAGAEKALGSHFRMLLFKKVAFIAIPLLIATGATTYWYTNQTTQEKQQTDIANQQPMVESIAETESSYSPSDKIETSTQTSATSDFSSANASEDFASSENNSETGALESSTDSKSNSINANDKQSAKSSAKENNNEGPAFAETSVKQSSDRSITKPKNQLQKADNSNQLKLEIPNVDLAMKTEKSNLESSSTHSFKSEIFDRQEMSQMPIYNISSLGKTKATLSAESNAQETILLKEARKFEFGVNGGILVSNALKNTQMSNPKLGFGGYFGLNATYHIKPRFFLHSAAVLNTRNALNSTFLFANSIVIQTPKQLVYLDIPIHVGYRIGARHSLSFGMTFSPLIGYSNHAASPDFTLEKTFEKAGFANFDVAGSAIYALDINQRINFNASIRFGLFDVTDDSYFKTALIDDRNHQLRIGINYKLRTR